MLCPRCGENNSDSNLFCSGCGSSLNKSYEQPQVQQSQQQQSSYQVSSINGTNYLVFSILATLFCCLPLGIPAIIFAAKIDRLSAIGDIAGAQKAAKNARLFIILSIIGCVVLIVLCILIGLSPLLLIPFMQNS